MPPLGVARQPYMHERDEQLEDALFIFVLNKINSKCLCKDKKLKTSHIHIDLELGLRN